MTMITSLQKVDPNSNIVIMEKGEETLQQHMDPVGKDMTKDNDILKADDGKDKGEKKKKKKKKSETNEDEQQKEDDEGGKKEVEKKKKKHEKEESKKKKNKESKPKKTENDSSEKEDNESTTTTQDENNALGEDNQKLQEDILHLTKETFDLMKKNKELQTEYAKNQSLFHSTKEAVEEKKQVEQDLLTQCKEFETVIQKQIQNSKEQEQIHEKEKKITDVYRTSIQNTIELLKERCTDSTLIEDIVLLADKNTTEQIEKQKHLSKEDLNNNSSSSAGASGYHSDSYSGSDSYGNGSFLNFSSDSDYVFEDKKGMSWDMSKRISLHHKKGFPTYASDSDDSSCTSDQSFHDINNHLLSCNSNEFENSSCDDGTPHIFISGDSSDDNSASASLFSKGELRQSTKEFKDKLSMRRRRRRQQSEEQPDNQVASNTDSSWLVLKESKDTIPTLIVSDNNAIEDNNELCLGELTE